MPRSGDAQPNGTGDPAAQLRAKAAHLRRLAREFQDNDRRPMQEFADELDTRARQMEDAGNSNNS
jgi:hypothetical protein